MRLRPIALLLALTACGSRVAQTDEAGVPHAPSLAEALGTTVQSDVPPPALAGGTLLVAADGALLVVSDPETDRVVVVDVMRGVVAGELSLAPNDEPGRAIEDASGRVHVAMRRGGALVTFDPHNPSASAVRRSVCPAPRGLAYDAASDVVHVACSGGELVTIAADPLGPILQIRHLASDLRDVVISGSDVLVTRFRSAEVLVVHTAGDPDTLSLVPYSPGRIESTVARVAWRAVASSEGALVLYQSEQTAEITLGVPGAYGIGVVTPPTCDGALVRPTLAIVEPTRAAPPTPIPCGELAVDVALSPDDTTLAVAVPGALPLQPCNQIRVHTLHADQGGGRWVDLIRDERACSPNGGRVVALAFGPNGVLWAQTRAPASVFAVNDGSALELGGPARADTGFDAFHSSSTTMLACASCHPEGGDDGHVWHFAEVGGRRTMSLRGGILSTAPFHWQGELATFGDLVHEVFAGRMGAGELPAAPQAALAQWLDAQPALPARTDLDPAAIARGRMLFENEATVCSTCHAGPSLSNETNQDVGTGGSFQVPALRGVGDRAPYLHDGRAATLDDRFGPMGGGDQHGHTSQLDAAQREDLVTYLRSL